MPGTASRIPSSVARTTPLDKLKVAPHATRGVACFGLQIVTQTLATPEAGPQRLSSAEAGDDFSANFIAAFA